jgi:hypothetical protein
LSLGQILINIAVALMDLGFATHGVHMDQRLVFLNATLSADRKSVSIVAPPSGGVYPPGPGYLFFVVDGGEFSLRWIVIESD